MYWVRRRAKEHRRRALRSSLRTGKKYQLHMLAKSGGVTGLTENTLRARMSPIASVTGRFNVTFVKRQPGVVSRADSAVYIQSALRMQSAEHKVLGYSPQYQNR